MPAGQEKALAHAISMQPVGTMPVDIKAIAQEIIAALKAEGLVMAQPGILPWLWSQSPSRILTYGTSLVMAQVPRLPWYLQNHVAR